MSLYLIVQGNCPDKESYKLNPDNFSLSVVRFFKFQTSKELAAEIKHKD